MSRAPRIWPAAASGLMVVACFPPFRLALLVFVALVPWLLYLRECDGKRAFRSGILFGFIFWLGEFSFVAKFVSHWTDSLALGCVPYLLGCLIGSFYFALFGWLANVAYRRMMPWAVPIAWAGVEVLRSYIFALAFPFGLLAMPLTPAPAIIQTAHYGSVFLVSAWVMLANVIVAEITGGKSYLQVRWYALTFFLLLVVSLTRYSAEPAGTLRHVVAGQPGVDLAFGDPNGIEGRVAVAIDRLSEEARGADLLVLPEGVIGGRTRIPPSTMFRVSKDLPVVFGGQFGENPSYQTAYSFDGHWEHAEKTRLVIFGEYVPLRSLLPAGFKLPSGDLSPSDKITTLNVGKFKVGENLCFEALFPDVSYKHAQNGANVLAVMSIDDWYFGTNAPEQLRDATNWRAIETGLPAVRAASLGFSMVSDARGRTVAQVPLYGTRVVGATVKVPDTPDLFPLFPVFPYLSILSLIAIPAYDVSRRRSAP